MWNSWTARFAASQIDIANLQGIVDRTNYIWAPTHVYFFIYAAQEEDFIPATTYCLSTRPWDWRDPAIDLYPVKAIPVAIVNDMGLMPPGYTPGGVDLGGQRIMGCACVRGTSCLSSGVVAVTYDFTEYVLTCELEHVIGGFTDDQIFASGAEDAIPISWYAQIQNIAKQFETPLPPDYFNSS
jgi:hypothetical protein